MRTFLLTAAFLLVACGTSADLTPAKRSTGTVMGTPAEQMVGASGGTVNAGSLAIQIPAGALAADTAITVTRVSSTAPGGRLAFRLGPDGTTFSSPVTLTFSYAGAEVAGGADEVMGIAWQDTSGVWVMPGEQTRDPANKTVSVKTTHFSDWSLVAGAQLRPPSGRVKVKGSLALVAKQCFVAPLNPAELDRPETVPFFVGINCDDEDIAPLPISVSEWAVNGVAGGSGSTGTISGTELGGATFSAPDTKPSPDQVAVSARADFKPFGKVLLVSNVTIVDDTPRMVATGRYAATNASLAPFVQGDVVDEGVQFTFNFPPGGGTVIPESLGGGGVSNVHDTRSGCMNPTLSGAWDVVTANSVQLLGAGFTVLGTYSHGAVTYGVGEGDCATMSTTQAATTGDFAEAFDFPAELFTSPTPPEQPLTVVDGPWTWTFEKEPMP